MEGNCVLKKSFEFSKRIVKLHKYLCENKNEFVMSKQLLRAGTSIGANIYEAQRGVSKRDFANKFAIALKEASECGYWIELLFETNYLDKRQYKSIRSDCDEINRLLTAIVKTSFKNNQI